MKRLFLIVSLLLMPVLAQVDTGVIEGTVTVAGPGGAAIPNAAVRITETQTNNRFEVSTNSQGSFVSPPLKVGVYVVNIGAAGFKTYVRAGIILEVQDRLRVDARLETGARTETVIDTGETPAVQSDTSSLGEVISGKQTTDMPLNGRDYTQLASLTGGVTSTSNGTNGNVGGSISSNGTRGDLNNFILDGVDNNDNGGGGAKVGVNVDAIAEFKVQTSAYDAEFGRAGGASINVVIKSGTNQVHGSVFEFFRNSYLDAQNYFSTGKKLSYKYNQPGVTFGGPLVKNRLFFFGDYQLTDSRTPAVDHSSVPIAGEASGDFSAPGLKIIYDPNSYVAASNTRSAFPGNIIPASEISPVGQAFAQLYPAPNVAGALKNNFVLEPTSAARTDQGDGRLDYRMSGSDQFFARYSQSGGTNYGAPKMGGLACGCGYSSNYSFYYSKGASLGETHTFTPTTLNEFRTGFNWSYNHVGVPPGGFQAPQGNLDIPGVVNDPSSEGLAYMAPLGFSGIGPGTFTPTFDSSEEREIRDALNLVRGRHTIRVGAEFRWTQFNMFQLYAPRGYLGFTGQYTNNPATASGGNGIADMLLGIPLNSFVDSLVYFGNRQYVPSLFAQDDFKVTHDLTLNLGVRWEYYSPLTDVHNHQSNFDYATGQLLVAGQNGNSDGLVTAQKTNFAPRIGFAYTPSGGTVFRGAYGIFYSGQEGRNGDPLQLAYNLPFEYQPTFVGNGIVPALTLAQGFPALSPSQAINPEVTSVDTNVKTPYYQEWNMAVQRALPGNMSLEVAYAGSKGVHLQSLTDQNQVVLPGPGEVQARRPYPNFGPFASIQMRGNSNFHSLQLKVEKHLSHGLSFLSAFTFSKGMDDSPPICCASPWPDQSYDLRLAKGLAEYNQKERWVTSFDYELPFGKGRPLLNHGRALDLILGGWHATGIFTIATGFPFTPTMGYDSSNTGTQGYNLPDRIRNGNLPSAQRSIYQWFDLGAFVDAPSYMFGNSGYNVLTAPGLLNLDGAIRKVFQITEHHRLEFRAEAFNFMNHPNFGQPDGGIDDGPGAAGVITTLNGAMRQVQLGIKSLF